MENTPSFLFRYSASCRFETDSRIQDNASFLAMESEGQRQQLGPLSGPLNRIAVGHRGWRQALFPTRMQKRYACGAL